MIRWQEEKKYLLHARNSTVTKKKRRHQLLHTGNSTADSDIPKNGFAKKGYTSLFLRQKGTHLENEKMRQQPRQEDQNATRHKRKPLDFNGRLSFWCLRSSWKSCLIFEQICSVTAVVVSDPQIIWIQSQIQIQRCNSKSYY